MDMGVIHLISENIIVDIKDFNDVGHKARINWIELFDASSSLYFGGYSFCDHYPYEQGGGIYLFRINTKTGKFTSLLDKCTLP